MIINTLSPSANTTQALATHFDFASFYPGLFLVLGYIPSLQPGCFLLEITDQQSLAMLI